ncbi:hypothetical protein BDF22DRAFT_741456 [Syncephalis plumigaleata]|nr:hypothetical protein BDF22DRAFT_741456 [Syncephalis plumigaleata]
MSTPTENPNIIRSFLNLSPRTRIYFGIGGLIVGSLGLFITDKLEARWEQQAEVKKQSDSPIQSVQNE